MPGEKGGEMLQPVPPSASSLKRDDHSAARLQFPRRVVLLLIAGGLAWALAGCVGGILDDARPAGPGGPLAEEIVQRLPSSALLLAAALALTLAQAVVVTAIAVAAHRLEARAGLPGSILKTLGRIWVFGQAAMPVFALALLGIFVFALQLRVLPTVSRPVGGEVGPLELVPYIVLPTFVLALLPTTLTAQATATELTLPRPEGGRAWLAALLTGLGTLAGQTGGLLSALVLVETVFAMPGAGRLFVEAVMVLELAVAGDVLIVFATVTLAGKLAAELFHWLKRLMVVPPAPAPAPAEANAPAMWRGRARRIGVAVALILLVLPLCQALAGLAVSTDGVLRGDLRSRNEGPSIEHWLGTDQMGRDNFARVLRGGAFTIGAALAAALLLTILGGLGGALTGWLANRGTLLFESLGDLAALPGEALLMLPVVPFAILISAVFAPGYAGFALAAAVLVLIPRAGRFFHTLWVAQPAGHMQGRALLTAAGALFAGALFAALWLIAGLDFLGFGTPPPAPTLGALLAASTSTLLVAPLAMLAPALALWLPAFAFYAAASALAGYFPTKEPLARLNT